MVGPCSGASERLLRGVEAVEDPPSPNMRKLPQHGPCVEQTLMDRTKPPKILLRNNIGTHHHLLWLDRYVLRFNAVSMSDNNESVPESDTGLETRFSGAHNYPLQLCPGRQILP